MPARATITNLATVRNQRGRALDAQVASFGRWLRFENKSQRTIDMYVGGLVRAGLGRVVRVDLFHSWVAPSAVSYQASAASASGTINITEIAGTSVLVPVCALDPGGLLIGRRPRW